MKKLFKLYSVILTAWVTLSHFNVAAQTYFAGAGAGAGNTGTLVTGVGTFALGLSNSGSSNAGFGNNALFKNSTGSNNSKW